MNQAHIFISGRVQGVGYRFFVKANAKEIGLNGWVRNTEDGGVEAIFQGEEDIIKQMIELCKKGPFMSEVKHVGFEWEDVEEVYTEFSIRSSDLI